MPNPTLLFGDPLPIATGKGVVPQPRLPREQQQEQLTRDLEIDPQKYYPPDVYREPITKLAEPAGGRSPRDGEGDGNRYQQIQEIAIEHRRWKSSDNGKAVPITILTGFLGAGKTTLLNRILTGNHGLRVGVLVNDFGSINIDAELVVGVDDNMISLANGCVCCQIRDDLVESVAALLARPEAIEYILLEASGVADPAGIFVTFNDPNLRDRIRLDSVTCVVDAEQVFAHPEYPPLMDLKLRQVGFADMLILNKVDLAGPEQVEKVRAWLDDHFNRLRIVETNYCEVPYEILLGVGRFDPARAGLNSHAVEHDCADPDLS